MKRTRSCLKDPYPYGAGQGWLDRAARVSWQHQRLSLEHRLEALSSNEIIQSETARQVAVQCLSQTEVCMAPCNCNYSAGKNLPVLTGETWGRGNPRKDGGLARRLSNSCT